MSCLDIHMYSNYICFKMVRENQRSDVTKGIGPQYLHVHLARWLIGNRRQSVLVAGDELITLFVCNNVVHRLGDGRPEDACSIQSPKAGRAEAQ